MESKDESSIGRSVGATKNESLKKTTTVHSLLQEFIRNHCTVSSNALTEETNKALGSSDCNSSSFYASFQSHTPEQQRVQFKFKLNSLVPQKDDKNEEESEHETIMKHNIRFTSLLAFLYQVVMPPPNDEQEAESTIISIVYSFLYDRFHSEIHSMESLDTIFWNTFSQGLYDTQWLEQLQGLEQLCSLPEILYMSISSKDEEELSLEQKTKKMKHSMGTLYNTHSKTTNNNNHNNHSSISKQHTWKRVYAMLGYTVSHILLSSTFDGVSYHEFIDSVIDMTSDDTIGFFHRMDRRGLYVSSEYSSFMVGVYGYVMDCMAMSTNAYMDDHYVIEQERLCQCHTVLMKIDLEFVIMSWCQDR
jgi:hypothetical protein